ncbi:MAG: AAA family ATPase [Deltaproteobacteria bacterium]|nr:AAA family ATPase [Deltaproteobacteria bacterium]
MVDAFSSPIREVLHAGCPVVCCETHEEARLDEAVTAIAAELGVPLVRWSLLDAPPGAAAVDALAEQLATLREGTGPLILLLADVHGFLTEPVVSRAIRSFVAWAPKGRRLILVSPLFRVPAELEHDVVVLSLPLPEPGDLAAVAAETLASLQLAAPPEALGAIGDALRGLTGSEARWVVRKAVRSANGGLPDASIVLREKGWRFSQVEAMEMVADDVPLDRLGGLDELKRWLNERREAFSRRARDFGLPPPRGLMLMGVQGCGKSLAAKAIARFWRVPIVRLDMGMIIGHAYPESVLRRAIRIAEAMAPVVLWVDEIEKGFSGENAGTSRRLLGGFVTWLQEKREPVFVVATANEVEALPPELPRKGRFDEIFFVDLPNHHERREIFEIHLGARGRSPAQFDLETLVRKAEKFSGSEIEQAVLSALYSAFSAGRELQNADLIGSVGETVPLATTFEDRLKTLREWARTRARPATLDRRKLDAFKP